MNVLAVLCLGALVSCSPSELENQPSASEPGRESSALILARVLNVSSTSLGFGNQKINTTSASQTVTLSAPDQSVTITNFAISGPYTVNPATLTTIGAGLSQTLTVRFAPTALGQAPSSFISFTSNSGNNASVSIGLTGFGVASAADIRTPTLTFGEGVVNGPGTPLVLTVHNIGDAAFDITPTIGGASPGAYSITPSPLTVPLNGSANFSVTFAPTAPGAANASISFTTTETGSPSVPAVTLTGTGVNPTIAVASTLPFNEQHVNTSESQMLAVTNTGTGTLKITGIAKTGAGAAAYTFTPTTLDVPEGQSRNLTVTFNPTTETVANATLTLTTNDTNSPSVPVTLTGTGVRPVIGVQATLPFNEQHVNTSPQLILPVTNTGTGTLKITNIVKGGTNPGAYSFTPATLDVPAGQSRNLTVTFSPTAEAATSATLTLTTNTVANPTVAVSLTGTGIRPIIGVQSTLAFNEQHVNTSPQLTVPVNNTGSGTLKITHIATSGADAALFSVTPATLDVPAGQSRNLMVTFAPVAEAAASATLTLTTNSTAALTVPISLTGTGIRPIVGVQATLAFNEQHVNTSAQLTVPVNNTGSGTLKITNITKSGAGMAAYNFTPATLDVPAGQSRNLTVTFNPTTETAANATLTLTTNSTAAPTVAVSLTGTGVRPVIGVQATLAFNERQVNTSPQLILPVNNTGTGTLRITNIVKGGTNPGAYSFTPATLDVPAGQSRNLTVTFNPVTQTATSATLTLTTNTVANPTVAVSLTGTGVNPIVGVQSTLAFGDHRVGAPGTQMNLAVNNTGSGTLRITQHSLSGTGLANYSVTPATLDVPAGQSRTLAVTFAPLADGPTEATLTLTTNDVSTPTVDVTLSGTGVTPTISGVPPSIDFGEQHVNTSDQQTVMVSNSGSGLLKITNITKSGTGLAAYSFSPATLDVPAGQSRTLTVTFNPTTEGPTNVTLTLTTNDVASPTVSVVLTGVSVRPVASVPPTLPFGEQRVGAPNVTLMLAVSNTGSGTLNITNPTLTGAGAGAYSVNPGSLAIPGGQSRDLMVTFAPSTEGAANATLTLTTNDVARPTVAVSLTGIGVRPVILVSPELAFGEHRVGAPGVQQTLLVNNTGSGTLHISNPTVSGPPGAYSVTQTTLDVPAGQSRPLTVTFSPPTTGAVGATLTLSTTDVLRPTVNISLTGTGVKPVASLPASLPFGEQRVGASPSATLALVVSNTGTGTLQISNPSLGGAGAGAYSVTPATLDVPAGQSGSLTVTFTPTTEGLANATLTLTTTDVARPTVAVSLTGTGIKPTISVNPAALVFGEQRVGAPSTVLTLAANNTGSGTLQITSPTITGAGAGAYSITPSTLDVPAGQSRNFTVTFAPTAAGAADATLTLTTTDVTKPTVSVPLSGSGVMPTISVSPASLGFGDVPVNGNSTMTLAVTNSGSGTLSISSVTKSGPSAGFFSFTPNVLDVPAGQSRNFTVTFAPTTEGQADASLTLNTNEVGRPAVVVPLAGYGGRPIATLTPPAVSFAGVRVGTSKQQQVTLRNTGRAPLIITTAPTVSPAGVFSYLGPSSITIPANGAFDFQVSFAPTQTTSYNATLTIVSNAGNSPTSLSLTGFGANPQLSVDTTNIFFGDVRVGKESGGVPVTLTVTNSTGQTDVTLQSLPVVGPFVVVLDPGVTLPRPIPSGSSFKFNVKFKPSEPSVDGPAMGSVTIITDLPARPTVALSGNGTISKVHLSVASLGFGAQRVGDPSGVQPVIITNTGAAELTISQIIFSNAAFSMQPVTDLVIGAGEQLALSVIFEPTTLGPTTGKLFIISDAYESATPLDLSGTGVDGQMSMTPSVVSFGSADVGAETQQGVTLKNIGDYPLKVEKVNAPSNAAFTVAGLPDGLVLQKNDEWPFTVTFKPQARGYVATSAIIESDAVTNPLLNLALSGTGVAAAVELQPTDISFGKSNLGVAVTQDLSIKNVGEKDLSVSNISFSDKVGGTQGAALDFSLDTGVALPLVVQAGKSTLVRLKFTPRGMNDREARARVFTNDKVAEANLLGVGTSPNIELKVNGQQVSNLEFGNVLAGNPSAPIVLRITNTGTGPLTLSTMTVGGADATAFIMTPPTLPTTLQADGFVEVSVSVKPDAERQFSGQLVVLSNDADTPNISVPMSAVGVRQQIQLSESTLDFGRQLINNPSSSRTVSVTNSSASRATLSALSVEGSGASQFTLSTLPLPRLLEPGKGVDLGVIFTAVAEAEVNSKLKVTFSEPPLVLEVALHGQGIPTVLSVRPAPLDFGTVRVGSNKREQPLTIANLSSEPITLSGPEVTYRTGEPFLYEPDTLGGRTIGPSSSIIVTMGYQPQAETLSETTLSLGTTTPPRPRSTDIQLKGRATNRLLTVDPGSLDFGRVDVRDPVEPKEITVVNKSSQQQRVVVKLKNPSGTYFTVDSSSLADPIAAEGSATFKVSFQPDKAGEETNEVQVWLQGENEPEALVSVTGSGRALTGQGGGCSSAGTSVGSALAMLALLVLGARRRRRA